MMTAPNVSPLDFNMSWEEIAAELGTTPEMVKSLAHRALFKVRWQILNNHAFADLRPSWGSIHLLQNGAPLQPIRNGRKISKPRRKFCRPWAHK